MNSRSSVVLVSRLLALAALWSAFFSSVDIGQSEAGPVNNHYCAVTSVGGVKCWGANSFGQLGDGFLSPQRTPVDVSGLGSGVIQVATGEGHSCALTSGGGVKCWGGNGFGQLGDNSTTDRRTPVDVNGLTSGVVQIRAGRLHSCALTSGGGVKCWGYNGNGQLGDGTTTDRLTPTNVSGLSSGAVQVSSGYEHTCALTSGGGVKCWGSNGTGQLGNGQKNTEEHAPVDVSGLTSGIVQISAGGLSSCALTGGGGIMCWGGNGNGQLGDGTNIDRLTAVDVSGLSSGVAQISLGFAHTCALTAGGGVKCWGFNVFGQLGDGTTTTRLTPTDVSGLASGMVQISPGFSHSCALTAGGGVKCWGFNGLSSLGDGTIVDRLTPVDVLASVGGAPFSGAIALPEGLRRSQTITITAPASKNYGDASFQVSASAAPSNLAVTLTASGNCSGGPGTSPIDVTITGAGSCTIDATQAGSIDYLPAQAQQNIAIDKANVTLNWTPGGNPMEFGTALTATQLNATATFSLAGVNTNVAGTFVYNPAVNAVLANLGSNTVTLDFTPSVTANFNPPAQIQRTITTQDTSAPTVASIVRANPSPTNLASVSWTVTFSENVSGVDAGDFALVPAGGISGAAINPTITGGPKIYTVSATTGNGNGSLGLNLIDNDSIKDAGNNPLGGAGNNNGNFTGEVYTIQKGPQITVVPTNALAGGSVTATWSAIPNPATTDWIGLYPVGNSDTQFLDWIYVSCGKAAGAALAAGSCPFTLPTTLVNGTYELRLFSNNSYARLAVSNSLTVGVVGQLPTVTVVTTTNAAEPNTSGLFTVTRSISAANTLLVNYTVSGTATANSDYTALSGSVTIAANATSATIPVNVINDGLAEGSETVIVTLSASGSYTVGNPGTATMTITDDDPQSSGPSLTATPDPVAPGGAVTANWTGIVNPSGTDWLGLYSPGAANTGFIDWIYVSCSRTAGAARGSGSCNFGIPAGLPNGSYQLRLFSNNSFNLLANSNLFTVSAGGQALPVVTIVKNSDAAEPATNGQFTISRNGGNLANPLAVNFIVNGTATPNSDYDALGTSIVIGPGSSSVTLPVMVRDDLIVEGTETVVVTLSNNAAYTIGNPGSAVVNIADNEQPAGTTLAVSPTTITRGNSVTATWAAIALPSPTDWLGLYLVGAPNTPYIAWEYVSCTQTAGAAQANGSCGFLIPGNLAAGSYELRLFSNNGFTRLATSNPFTVQ